jgi:hypothetical protein
VQDLSKGEQPWKVEQVIDDTVADFLESVGLPILWQSLAPFYAAELQILRSVDCCLRAETACFGDMEDRVADQLANAIKAAAHDMTDAERAAFFPIWDQLDEPTQLYVLNGYNDMPPMECGPKDCKMRHRRRAVATHDTDPKLN